MLRPHPDTTNSSPEFGCEERFKTFSLTYFKNSFGVCLINLLKSKKPWLKFIKKIHSSKDESYKNFSPIYLTLYMQRKNYLTLKSLLVEMVKPKFLILKLDCILIPVLIKIWLHSYIIHLILKHKSWLRHLKFFFRFSY